MINKHVVSLDLAKQLYEAGIVVESEFYWVKIGDTWKVMIVDLSCDIRCMDNEKYPAPLSSELGELLPDYTQKLGNLEISKCDTDHTTMKRQEKRWWNIYYWHWENAKTKHGDVYLEKKNGILVQADTEANARAKMLLYLKEKGLL